MPDAPVPTIEEYATGRAMVVNCNRGGELKCHLFLDTDIVSPLLLEDSDEAKKRAQNVLAHELAHVYDSGRIGKELANQTLPEGLTRWLFLLTNATWSEYCACMLTAEGDPSLDDYVTTFLNALDQCPKAVREQIIAYRRHGDTQKLMEFVKDRVGLLFKFAGYVIGNLDGTGRQLSQTHPDAWRSIQDAGFSDTWSGLEAALKEMEEENPWKDVSVYDGLGRTAISYLNSQGLFPREANGMHVDIPFTPETMPPGWSGYC
jgi:hypothetical protein